MLKIILEMVFTFIGLFVVDKVADMQGASEDEKFNRLRKHILEQEQSGYEDYQ